MKKLLFTLVISSIAVSFAVGADPEPKDHDPELKDQKDKVSYSIGLEIGSNLKRSLVDVNQDIFTRGIHDGIAGGKTLLTKDQMKETMLAFQKDLRAKQTAARKEVGEKNKAEGDKFLADNKKKDGVKTTKSGLQYKVLKEGSGPTPKETETVKVNYRGTTVDGKEFDSSFKRNEPASFPVGRVIKGWTEGLQLMNVGSKYQFVIPANLAYGERGAGQTIGPNSVLIFEVELLGIDKTPKPINPLGAPGVPGAIPTPASIHKASPSASASETPAPSASASSSPTGP